MKTDDLMRFSSVSRFAAWVFPETVVPVARDARPMTYAMLLLQTANHARQRKDNELADACMERLKDHQHAGKLVNAEKREYECLECGERFEGTHA